MIAMEVCITKPQFLDLHLISEGPGLLEIRTVGCKAWLKMTASRKKLDMYTEEGWLVVLLLVLIICVSLGGAGRSQRC